MITEDYRFDRRSHRARALTAAIMQEIGPLLGDNRAEASRAIEDLLWRLGIDPLSDAERERIGVRPRDNKGWTDEEVRIHDSQLKMAMLEAVRPPVFPAALLTQKAAGTAPKDSAG